MDLASSPYLDLIPLNVFVYFKNAKIIKMSFLLLLRLMLKLIIYGRCEIFSVKPTETDRLLWLF